MVRAGKTLIQEIARRLERCNVPALPYSSSTTQMLLYMRSSTNCSGLQVPTILRRVFPLLFPLARGSIFAHLLEGHQQPAEQTAAHAKTFQVASEKVRNCTEYEVLTYYRTWMPCWLKEAANRSGNMGTAKFIHQPSHQRHVVVAV